VTTTVARLGVIAVVAVIATGAALACTENLTAPGRCPQYCPPEAIAFRDTILDTSIVRDSAFGRPIGYVNPSSAPVMLAESLPGIRGRVSRAIFRFNPSSLRRVIRNTDTTTGPLLQADSVFVRLQILRRDSRATNLTLHLYRMPLSIDSTTTFTTPAVSDSFALARIRGVNLDTLLARPTRKDSNLSAGATVHFDSATGDRLQVDSILGQPRLVLTLKFDSLAVPFDSTDSGKVALGVRVTADSFASATFGTSEVGQGPTLFWFNRFDSLGTKVSVRGPARTTAGSDAFDGMVFSPAPTPLDSNLTVGGLPAARSLLRVQLPRSLLDSTQIVRATLILVPADTVRGVPSDSFELLVHAAAVDFGQKSPLVLDISLAPDSLPVRVGTSDTLRVDVTNILRRWQTDTTLPHTLVLQQGIHMLGLLYEGASLTELHLYSSRAAQRRPALRITYVPQIQFAP
jgi:hypothetical protein